VNQVMQENWLFDGISSSSSGGTMGSSSTSYRACLHCIEIVDRAYEMTFNLYKIPLLQSPP